MRSTDNVPLRKVRAAIERRATANQVRASLDPVLRRHEPRMYRLFFGVTGDPALSRQLTRTAMRRAWRELPDLADERAWVWLFQLTRRMALAAVRQTTEPLLEDGVYQPRDAGWQILRNLSRVERRAVLDAAAAQLDPQTRQIAYLRYAESLPCSAIQRMLRVAGTRDPLDRVRRDLGREIDRRLLG